MNQKKKKFRSDSIKIRRIQNLDNLDQISQERLHYLVNELYDFVEQHQYDGSSAQKDILDSYVTQIYDAEICGIEKNFKNQIKLFIGDEANIDCSGTYVHNYSISINTNELYKELNDNIVINRVNACKNLLQTISHEIQHHRQYLMAKSTVGSKEAMLFAKDYAVQDVLGDDFSNDNYYELIVENDAEETALNRIFGVKNNADSYDKMELLQFAIKKKIGNYSVNKVESQSGNDTYNLPEEGKEEIIDKVLDNEILYKKNVKLLKDFPILQKIYTKNCTKRDTNELIENMKKEKLEIANNEFLKKTEREKAIQDLDNMYLDLIYKSLEDTDTKDLKVNDVDELNLLLDKMYNTFKKEYQELIEKEKESFELEKRILLMEHSSEAHVMEQLGEIYKQRDLTRALYKKKLDNVGRIKEKVRPEYIKSTESNNIRKKLKVDNWTKNNQNDHLYTPKKSTSNNKNYDDDIHTR